MYSSCYFDKQHSKLIYWEYENGVKVERSAPPPLYFYLQDTNTESEYRTIYGDPARRIESTTWRQHKEKIEKYQEWGKHLFESDISVENKFIVDHYMGMELKVPNFDIHYLDIEVHSEEGFPKPEHANFPITIITVWSTKHNKFFIFAEKDFDESFITKAGESCQKFIFSREDEMIKAYMNWTRQEHPDIITGWHSNGFDIPYIINRARKLFGYEENEKGWTTFDGAADISPVGIIHKKHQREDEIIEDKYEIIGINCLDMLEIYQNYTFSEQESWKLGYITQIEIGETKNEYQGSLADLHNNHWQQYVEYNVQDVRLLRKLEDKKKFIPLLVTFCYGCRVPFEQYQKTTRVLDGAFLSKLAEEKVVLPDVNRATIEKMKLNPEKYIGGYVKQPIAGLHKWVLSFDATSLYPSIMMGWNISPETKIGVLSQDDVKPLMKMIAGHEAEDKETRLLNQPIMRSELAAVMKEKKWCLAANGAIYRNDVRGIIARFVKEWFDKRKAAKKKMLAAEKNRNKEQAEYWHAIQLNFKILINSVYGYLGTPYSRFFDWDNAVAVTMSARYVTMTTESSIKGYFNSPRWLANKKYKPQKVAEDGIIYADTDSVYVDFGKIFDSMGYDAESKPQEAVKNFIIYNTEKTNDEFTEDIKHSIIKKDNDTSKQLVKFIAENNAEEIEKIVQSERESIEEKSDSLQNFVGSIINKAMKSLTMGHFNCQENLIYFKREAVATRAIFLERKKYVMWVLNSEGVELPEKKRLKVTGFDIVRSSTPSFVRNGLKQIVKDILVKLDEKFTIEEIRKVHADFMTADPTVIAFPRAANNVTKYREKMIEDGKFKSTPIQVRAAIIYNQLLSENPDLIQLYDKIYDGDKMMFVYAKPNHHWRHDVFGWKDKWIKDRGFEESIDRKRQFEVSVQTPLNRFFELLGWHMPDFECHDMTSLFVW